MTIRALDEDTIRKIAAGEVIERPASVVKELVENSLDAGASRIDVAVEGGGKERIRVADDGAGMTEDEVRTAVREHTTSKIDGAADLERVGTLGFRGEALHAIGAVSRMGITTRPAGGARATELTVAHGEVVAVGPAGRPEGTTVEVTDLFAEMPARRKFMKEDATEFDHVNRIVARYALANPDVAVSLIHDDRETFSTTGRGDLEGALLSVYGREVAESMIPVGGHGDGGGERDRDGHGDGDGYRVSGYVSHPETTRSTRAYVSTFANDRYVAAPALRNAVVAAYGNQLAPDRYPFAVLFLSVPPASIDVNVHPRKLEIRFDDEGAVRETVRGAVEGALLDHGLVRSGAPRGRSAPEETTIDPGSDRPDPASTGDPGEGSTAPAGGRPDPSGPESGSRGEAGTATGDTSTPAASGDASAEDRDRARDGPALDPDVDLSPSGSAPLARGDESAGPDASRLLGTGQQSTLDDGRTDEPLAFDRLPAMRLLGQLHDTYLVAETDGGLVLVDQHAADERVTYERLRARVADDSAVQQLAAPVELELTAREAALLPAFEDALREVGFRTERVDDRTVAVGAVPAVLSSALDPSLLRDVLVAFVDGAGEGSVESRADALLADLACYPSITGHTPLTEGSIRRLLAALDDCEDPYSCPHGRPVVIELTADELADRFERDYPGHPGRRED